MGVQGEIFRWVRGFPSWKQELFIRAAAAPRLVDEDVSEITDLLLGEAGDDVRTRKIAHEDLTHVEGVEEPMVIERITGLRNVNALDGDQTLAFEPHGVNVVYGANGAGKTGYSRVLRKAGRTLYTEDVLSNIYSSADEGPAATLVVKVGDTERSEELDLDAEPPRWLARIHIADYRAGEIYLTKETEVDYVPATLASLSRLANGLNAVKAELQRRRAEVDIPEIDLRLFGEGTRVADFIANLDATSSERELRALASLSEKQDQALVGLRRTMAEVDSLQAPRLRAVSEQEAGEARRLRADLRFVAGFVDGAGIAAAREREAALDEAAEAVELAARQLEAQPLDAVGSGPWRLLWGAAREYAAHLGQALPDDHDPAYCPLCMQELSAPAQARLRSFEEFVAGEVNAHLVRLEEEKVEALAALPDCDVIRERHRNVLDQLGTEDGERGAAVVAWLRLARAELGRIERGDAAELTPLGPPPDIDPWIKERAADVKRHVAIEGGEGQAKVRTAFAELRARRVLADHLDDAVARLDAMKRVARITEAMTETKTNVVTTKVRIFSRELVQAGLEEALKRQLRELEFRDIEVVPTTRGVRGKPVAGLAFKAVGGVPLTDVLSQGEQRRLALAMFLAEMEVRSDVSPVVFDDPTSSIDQEGRRRIAHTLLKLGRSRQVIVFTHELSLVHELQSHPASPCPVSAQHIKRMGDTVGHVQPSLPWEGLSPTERSKQLNRRLELLKQTYAQNDDERYAEEAAAFCSRLRAAFERAVEDSVLAGVVTRRADDVQTKRLRAINWSEEICELVDCGMSEASPWVHDRPLHDGSSPPSPRELEEGLAVYGELLEKTNAMRTARDQKEKVRKKERRRTLREVDLASVSDPDGDGAPGSHLRSVSD